LGGSVYNGWLRFIIGGSGSLCVAQLLGWLWVAWDIGIFPQSKMKRLVFATVLKNKKHVGW